MGKLRCFRSLSADSVYSYVGDSDTQEMEKAEGFFTSWHLWQKVLFICGLIILGLLILIFLTIWVIFPLVYMNTIAIQRFFIFWNIQIPKNPDFNNPQKYGMDGIVNFYITTLDTDNTSLVSIGTWLVLPESQIDTTNIKSHDNQTASEILGNTTYPIILYLHGVGANRIKVKEPYEALRKHFMVVSPDHRGYGDSGPALPSEEGIISDSAQIFKWIRSKTNNDIYVWGHSLGTALSTHTVRKLRETYNIVPKGLVLEAAFTTMREEIPATQLGQLFSWMPWFEATVLNPLERNGFLFRTTSNIIYVDCPIMSLHALDDNVIPYTLGRRVVEVARTQRNIPVQGNVTSHEFDGLLGYAHTGIPRDPNLPKYINEFIGYCNDQNKSRG